MTKTLEEIKAKHDGVSWDKIEDLADELQGICPSDKDFRKLLRECYKDKQDNRQIVIALLGLAMDWWKYGN